MHTKAILAAVVALLLLAGGPLQAGPAGGAEEDTAAIKKRAADFVAAWGKHDAKGLAAVWAEDGDLINPWGRKASGRAEVEKLFTDEQTGQGPMRESAFKLSAETVRFPTADVAVSDWQVTISGAYGPDGAKGPAMDFLVPVVWRKTGGTWSIYSARPYAKPPPPTPPVVK